MALLFGDERVTKAVLSFLRKTKVGQIVTIPPRDEEERKGGEEGRLQDVMGGSAFPGAPFCFLFCLVFPFLLFFPWGGNRKGCPTLNNNRTPHIYICGEMQFGGRFWEAPKGEQN